MNINIRFSMWDNIAIKLDEPTVHHILDKLTKDGYAKIVNIKFETPLDVGGGFVRHSEYTYIVTFEGQIFKEAGGYGQQEIDNNLKKANLQTVENIRRRNERLIVRGTIALAIGTFALVAWEAFQWWYEHFYCT